MWITSSRDFGREELEINSERDEYYPWSSRYQNGLGNCETLGVYTVLQKAYRRHNIGYGSTHAIERWYNVENCAHWSHVWHGNRQPIQQQKQVLLFHRFEWGNIFGQQWSMESLYLLSRTSVNKYASSWAWSIISLAIRSAVATRKWSSSESAKSDLDFNEKNLKLFN